MASWSAKNATNAYLRAIKMVSKNITNFTITTFLLNPDLRRLTELHLLVYMMERENEPDTSEFISALVAGKNARLMVVACAGAADGTTLALLAAAHQTGGTVVCILAGSNEEQLSKEMLGESAADVKFVIGNAENLVAREYREADCVVVDCRIANCEGILRSVGRDVMVLGYNALCGVGIELDDGHLLPIGEGLVRRNPGKKDGYDFGSV